MLVLNYKSRGGGRPSAAGRDDLKATNGCVMLAHFPPAEGRPGYTCNKRVTPADIHGHGGSVDATGAPSSPVALSIMSDLTYEGANVDIPEEGLDVFDQQVCLFALRFSTVFLCYFYVLKGGYGWVK